MASFIEMFSELSDAKVDLDNMDSFSYAFNVLKSVEKYNIENTLQHEFLIAGPGITGTFDRHWCDWYHVTVSSKALSSVTGGSQFNASLVSLIST